MAIILMAVSILPSCSRRFSDSFIITKAITDYYHDGNNTVNLSQLTTFKWDSVYFFSGEYDCWESINKIVPCYKPEQFIDIGSRLIFTYQGHFVYEETWFSTDTYPKYFTLLCFEPYADFFVYSNDEAVFSITEEEPFRWMDNTFIPLCLSIVQH